MCTKNTAVSYHVHSWRVGTGSERHTAGRKNEDATRRAHSLKRKDEADVFGRHTVLATKMVTCDTRRGCESTFSLKYAITKRAFFYSPKNDIELTAVLPSTTGLYMQTRNRRYTRPQPLSGSF